MKTYRMTQWGHPAVLMDAPVPEPGPGEVVIRVGAAGACHSDLHVMEWPPGRLPWDLPFTLGHETAGWVHAVGPGVEGVPIGEAVAVYGPWGCGRCGTCREGMENYCERQADIPYAGGGLGRDGGMAEFMLLPSPRFLVPIRGLDPVQAAPLTDAGLTSYHAVKRSLPVLVPGSAAVVIGVGGLGHMAVQILKALAPARVVAVDVSEEKLDLAVKLGADEAVPAAEDTAARIRRLTGGLGAHAVLDFVGSDETLALAVAAARPRGDIALVGLAGGTLPFSFFGVPYEASLATTYWGSVTELMEVVELAEHGLIHVEVERFPLERAAEAYERMKAGSLRGRAVIVPGA